MIKSNFHTHCYLCGHAEGDIEDYVEKAIDLGFTELGMSDHGPIDIRSFYRMSYDEFLNVYLKDLDSVISKYSDKIKIYKGIEIEYLYGKNDYYKGLLDHLDYLVLGTHYYSGFMHTNDKSSYAVNNKEKLVEYTKLIVDALDTGYFKILAHPDLFMMGYPHFDEDAEKCTRELIDACIRNNVYIEFNMAGIRKNVMKDGNYCYPNGSFFKVCREYDDLKIIASSDSHRPSELFDDAVKKGIEILEDLGIEPSSSIF